MQGTRSFCLFFVLLNNGHAKNTGGECSEGLFQSGGPRSNCCRGAEKSYDDKETILFTTYPSYGNLI